LKNTKIWIFGGISKFHFGQILAALGGFGQFWADFAILAVVDIMPKLRLKS
jgi:hypothetical protein